MHLLQFTATIMLTAAEQMLPGSCHNDAFNNIVFSVCLGFFELLMISRKTNSSARLITRDEECLSDILFCL